MNKRRSQESRFSRAAAEIESQAIEPDCGSRMGIEIVRATHRGSFLLSTLFEE
jgi:hypothetical protein